ncbi:hypothetical protein QBC43DRAFT_360673 [Cladorrhinum sp. PSN259]|nr:hypothetical protein QBC43DRAFT_360673 [Cladorrhinum sp. PSN259]
MVNLRIFILFLGVLLLSCFTNVTFAQPRQPRPRGGPRPPFYYWFDDSCTAWDPNFDDWIQDIFYMARSAASRLRDNNDADFHNVFWAIFKIPRNDIRPIMRSQEAQFYWGQPAGRAAYQYATETLDSLGRRGNWLRAGARQNANIRIYCDNGNRYDTSQAATRGEIYDRENVNWQRIQPGELWHQCTSGLMRPIGATTDNNMNPADDSTVAWYSIIDMCDFTFHGLEQIREAAGAYDVPRTFQELQQAYGDLHGYAVWELVRLWPSIVLFHEFLHAPPHWGLDTPGADRETGGWTHLMGLAYDQLFQAPEAWTQLGLLAALADLQPEQGQAGGYTIDRRWATGINDVFKWQAWPGPNNMGIEDNFVYQGLVFAYRDITGTRTDYR